LSERMSVFGDDVKCARGSHNSVPPTYRRTSAKKE
jgi:hypothetical protein